jgi:hypothetical protein
MLMEGFAQRQGSEGVDALCFHIILTVGRLAPVLLMTDVSVNKPNRKDGV